MRISKGLYWLIIALAVITSVYVYRLQFQGQAGIEDLDLNKLPLTIGRFRGVEKESKIDYYDESRLGKKVGSQYIIRGYSDSAGNSLDLYVGYFNYRKGSEHHNPDTCFAAQGWQLLDRHVVSFGSPPREAISMQVVKGLNRIQILFWFQTESSTLVNKWRHQLYLIKQSMLGNSARGVVVRLAVPINNIVEAEKALTLEKEFAGDLFKILPEYLQ